MSLGKHLKALRKQKGVTQQEVASMLGVKQNTYSQYENDKREPDVISIIALSHYYKVSVETILAGVKEYEEIMDEEPSLNVMFMVERLRDDERFKDYSFSELVKMVKKTVKEALYEKFFNEDGSIKEGDDSSKNED